MPPRAVVLCSDCARPQPWKWPVTYWNSRFSRAIWVETKWRSPEWWDHQTSLADLRVAAANAAADILSS